MKVGIICYNHFDATISLGKYLLRVEPKIEVEYIFLLSQSRLNVEILSLEDRNLENGFVSKQELNSVIEEEILDYISKIQLNVFIFNSVGLTDYKNYALLFQLKKYITSKHFDLLHFVGNNPWIALLNYLIKRVPKIHTLHEPFPFVELRKYWLWKFKSIVKLILHSSTYIIVPSEVSYERLSKHYTIADINVSIIPFGPFEIYKEFATKKIVKEKHTVLFYGNISKYKGIEILIEAMKRIYPSIPNLKLIIAGSGCFNYDLSSCKMNIVLINKHLSNYEIAELNQLATVIVCPYTSASQSGVVMTSFAFGNPIVATNVGALPEVIENGVTGIIIEPNSDTLTHALFELFRDTGIVQELRRNVWFKYSNANNDWLQITKQTLELYKRAAIKSD